jgi:hypothetical protein
MQSEPAVAGEPEAAHLGAGAARPRDEEFLEFVAVSGRYLLRTAVLLCGDRVRAEELVQATCERTYRSWRVARRGDPQAYARRVLVNLRIDGWRPTRHEVLVEPVAMPDRAGPDYTGAVVARNAVAAFNRISDAIEHSGVNIYRIGKGGWGPGMSLHLRDNSWEWNWYYSYIPGTAADATAEQRSETSLGTRLQVHVGGNWWFTVEPDD